MTTELSTRPPTLAPLALPDMFKLGEMLVTTGFLPKAVDTPAKCVAIMLKGQELGIPPMYALNNIAIVNGKQVCQAELMLAMIYRDHGSKAIEFLETNERVCRIRYQRQGGQPGEFAFTVEEADTAGLLSKPGPPGGVAPWKGYRPAMLRARAISAMARAAFPDTIAGMYTPEEVGARVVVTEDGEIVMDEGSEATERPPAPAPRQPTTTRAHTVDGEVMRPPRRVAPSPPLFHGEDPLSAERAERDRLMFAFSRLLDEAAGVTYAGSGFAVEELDLDAMSNAELLGAGRKLRADLDAFKASIGADLSDDEVLN